MKNKLRAFTILEMLMSISIMAIVISMVYFLYTSFSKQVYSYVDGTYSKEKVLSFYTQFRSDVYLANKIKNKDNRLIFDFYEKDPVIYDFDSNKITRKQLGQKDEIDLLKYSFKEIKVLNNENLIEQINFETLLLRRKINFTINKAYTSTILLDYNGN